MAGARRWNIIPFRLLNTPEQPNTVYSRGGARVFSSINIARPADNKISPPILARLRREHSRHLFMQNDQ